MGTSLTGTKPKDTYDSLIKVGDNGPISGTAKYLSDGLGNDLPIAVSTSNVGIGTSAPNAPIQINGAPLLSSPARATIRTFDTSSPAANVGAGLMLGYQFDTGQFVDAACVQAVKENATLGNYATSLAFLTRANGVGFVENVRILSSGGITFNGDTAAANALDDYEEGTFTATLKGSVSDPSTPVTTTANYTKIGRQVTVSIVFTNINTTGAAGAVSVSGLPFTIGSTSTGAALTEFFDFGASRTSIGSFAGAGGSIINFFATGDDAAFDSLIHNAGTGRYLWTTVTYFV